ncbi:DNA methylase N-4/N-6 domain protein [Thermocrinis albus DSM 14484]|uniref:site-specific DNA-methyltransferase (adenine-specific) n=1 Tax=Thermocrinis albus (strain DSM 14484 / JCM 11386 / HI 11/12) TaxID=638303 RepID=D3SMD6_THEAH|nr:site-specific DNA-methyltransferase [Thermocrinis albus]ADC89916.1 DNA methylase N-4/N-6 domain protein [Thermocrinis albus DSM 14484]
MEKERRFFEALKNVFVGEKIEGESGYINLMRIKSKYYEKRVFPKLKEDIDSSLKEFPDFREELFDKLYTFFKRYFSESGSIYFVHTPYYQSIYDRIYTDDRDVVLFWKTHMLYYVKTDRLFKSLNVEIDGYKFFFDASKLEHKKANEKREVIYELKEVRADNTIVFEVHYSERGRKTNIDDIIKDLRKGGIRLSEEVLERAFRTFERQAEVDFFINKNAKEFLKEQFDLWLYQYVFKENNVWTERRIKQLQVLKDIAFKIIDFISQFEDELVKIWNKPRFVINSNYVITLDRIAKKDKNLEIIEKILNHQNFEEQIKEWKELKIVEEDFDKNKILENTLTGRKLNEKYQFLPIDTKYFKDLELEILGLFDDLDNELDGWLIKSENYQALNTILPKFKEKVQTIYIDPPFNKEQDADYFYSVKYKDATWITMLENRLRLARDLLRDTGSIFVRCDYNGNMYVRLLMNEIFGEENFRNEIVVKRGAPKSAMFGQFEGVKSIGVMYDNIFWYSSNPETRYHGFKIPIKKKGGYWSTFYDMKPSGERPTMRYELFGLLPPKNYYWKWGKERALKAVENYKKYLEESKETGESIESYSMRTGIRDFIKLENGVVKYWVPIREEDFLDNNWLDIPGYSSGWGFKTENSEILLKRVIESTSNEGDLVMDFFLGSGTTTAVAHKLKRKWIGVEMGEHFYTVVLPRMKKVLAYDKSGISKEKDVKEKYNEKNAGGFFKYYELEQYEDILRRAKYEDSEDLFENPYTDIYNQYVFLKDLKMLEAVEIDYENNKVKVDLSKLYDNIDLAETLSNLLGKWIKKITSDYVEFEDGERIDLKDIDYKIIKPLIWW